MVKLSMSMTMEDDIKRWTSKRKVALVMEIIQGKSSISETSRSFDVSPAEIKECVDEAKRGIEIALRAMPLEISKNSMNGNKKSCRRHTVRRC